jgi:SAM-dependent methyltransferase
MRMVRDMARVGSPLLRRDLGDFQTPPGLVSAILDRLDSLGVPRSRVLEPTCGRGHFLAALLDRRDPPREMFGLEIQADHLEVARASLGADPSIGLEQADLFAIDLARRPAWRTDGPLLVVGNPPWVTTAELGRLNSTNRPSRSRIAGVSGLDARTGRSNFDLAEAVWVKLLSELDEPGTTIALLCKTATARNVLRWGVRASRPIASASIHRIDARQWFGAAVDACLFVVRIGQGTTSSTAEVYADLASDIPESVVGVVDGMLVADLEAFGSCSHAFGRCTRTWRQGVKHDAAGVMELVADRGGWRNGRGEIVDVEPDRLFPLLKGADLASDSGDRPTRGVLVTQHRLGEDTRTLSDRAPRLWSYLGLHAGAMSARKSKIYSDRPPYAMFGIGDYTFAPHKVAVSGLHKSPVFRAIGPVDGRPVLLDDTCYFLPCETAIEAADLATRLNGPIARTLIGSLTFRDAKRPITKALLQRIDIDRLEPSVGWRPLASPCGVE